MRREQRRNVATNPVPWTVGLLALAPMVAMAAGHQPGSAKAPKAAGGHPSIAVGDNWTLSIDGQYKPRFIADTGFTFVKSENRMPDSGTRALVNHRARLGASMTNKKGVMFRILFQDVRTWGEEGSPLNDFSANGLDVQEAYVVLPFSESLKLKLGRQEIIFDNHRLVGNVDWVHRAQSFDAARLLLAMGQLEATLFVAKVREADSDISIGRDGTPGVGPDTGFDIDFGGFHAKYTLAPGHKLSVMFLSNADQTPGAQARHTTGFHLTGKASGFAYTGEFFYQFGPNPGGDAVSAFLAAGRAGYTLGSTPLKPSLTAWFEYLSGNSDSDGGATNKTFNTLYATNHKFYGEMDFFLNTNVHTFNRGLMDIGGRLGLQPHSKIKTHVDLHVFRSAQTLNDESSFGTEINVKMIYTMMEGVWIRAVYGLFLPGELMRAHPRKPGPAVAPGIDLQPEHFVYVTTDVKF